MENQNDAGIDIVTGSGDTHDPIEENIHQDQSNTSAQSVACDKSFTRNMDIRYKVEDHDSWERVKLLSCAGKVGKRGSEKYRSVWSVENPPGNKLSLSLDKVAVWEEASDTDEVNEESLLHKTYVTQISHEVHIHDVKLCELD